MMIQQIITTTTQNKRLTISTQTAPSSIICCFADLGCVFPDVRYKNKTELKLNMNDYQSTADWIENAVPVSPDSTSKRWHNDISIIIILWI